MKINPLRRENGEQRQIDIDVATIFGVTEKGTENGLTKLYESLGFDVLDEEDSRRMMAQQASAMPQRPGYEAPVVAVPQSGLAEVAPETVVATGLEQPVVPGVTPLPGFGGDMDAFDAVVEPYNWDEMAKETPHDGYDLAA